MPQWLKDILSDLSAITTILGFGVIGVLTTARSVTRFVLRAYYSSKERRVLGSEYLYLKSVAIKDGLYDTSKSIRLLPILEDQARALRSALASGLQDQLLQKLGRIASGSTTLRYKDILEAEGLLLPLKFKDRQSNVEYDLDEVLGQVMSGKTATVKSQQTSLLLIASAGWGKTLSCLSLEQRLVSTFIAGKGSWILLITAQDFWDVETILRLGDNAGIGSEAWCAQLLILRFGWTTMNEISRRALNRQIRDYALVVIDGIDEISARVGNSYLELFLNSWVFDRAALVTTRSSFFYTTLSGHPSLKKHRIIEVVAPTKDLRRDFLQAVCLRIYGAKGTRRVRTIWHTLNTRPHIYELASAPLLLMMLTELDINENSSSDIIDSIWVYGEFTQEIIRRDAQRIATPHSHDNLMWAYQEIAWTLFRKQRVDDNPTSGLNLKAIKGLLEDPEVTGDENEKAVLVEVVVAAPLITALSIGQFGNEKIKLGFSHESFMEYHVARRVYKWLSGDADRGEDFFSFLETPGVSAFLKEYLARTVRDKPVARSVNSRLAESLRRLIGEKNVATDERSARRASFMAGQMAYYLGMVADTTTVQLLYDIAADQNDFWVRRSAAVGLAFGGRAGPLNELVSQMRVSVFNGEFELARKNIAIELGFYGDQRFDPDDPTFDAGGESCERIVTTICNELCLDAEAPNRRMALFDLVFLSKYREVSRKSFNISLSQSKNTLLTAIRKIEAQSTGENVPEAREVCDLLMRV